MCYQSGMVLWLLLLLGGNLALVAGLFLTRRTWRSDVAPFDRGSPTLRILLHPEEFATTERLGQIRFLNWTGLVLLAGSSVLLIAQLVVATRHG